VVTYVANADNYRQKYNNLRAERDSLDKKVDDLTKQVNKKISEKQQAEDRLNEKIASLKVKSTKLQSNLKNTEREKSLLLQKVNSWTSITRDFYETNDKQGQLLKNTLDELNNVQAKQIRQKKELDETTVSLIEKMAIIETLEVKTRRLLEEKTELQSRLDKLLRPFGQAPAETVPVTPETDTARPPAPETGEIALQGLVTEVDLKNSLASISLGEADGVKEGMRFHVSRGDEFLCDILIIDVDSEDSVGVLELVQQQPKIGDNVSTNL
jgi:seryl-tRNA synthetase